ncbi:MAG: hypothetical protein AAF802_09315 [Planctomycetota bacterium]
MRDHLDARTYFWPYDFFGYLLPGVIVLVPLLQFQNHARQLFENRYQADSIIDNVVLLVSVYVLGHLVAAAASLILERIVLQLSFGYPLEQFFCGAFAGPLPRRLALRCTRFHSWKAIRNFNCVPKLRSFHAWLESMGEWLERRLDLIPGYCHCYDPRITRLIRRRFADEFGVEFRNWSIRRRTHEVYWLIWAFVAEKMPSAYRSSMHFLELYGFCRNACFAFLVLAMYPLCPGWNVAADGSTPLVSTATWSITCIVIASLLYANFAKLIRRQNDFMMRAFIAYPSTVSEFTSIETT